MRHLYKMHIATYIVPKDDRFDVHLRFYRVTVKNVGIFQYVSKPACTLARRDNPKQLRLATASNFVLQTSYTLQLIQRLSAAWYTVLKSLREI